MSKGLSFWVSVSPDVEELPLSLSDLETTVVPYGASGDCAVRTQHLKLPGYAVEVAANKNLSVCWEAGQQCLHEVVSTASWFTGCVDADCCEVSSGEREVDAEGSAILGLVP